MYISLPTFEWIVADLPQEYTYIYIKYIYICTIYIYIYNIYIHPPTDTLPHLLALLG